LGLIDLSPLFHYDWAKAHAKEFDMKRTVCVILVLCVLLGSVAAQESDSSTSGSVPTGFIIDTYLYTEGVIGTQPTIDLTAINLGVESGLTYLRSRMFTVEGVVRAGATVFLQSDLTHFAGTFSPAFEYHVTDITETVSTRITLNRDYQYSTGLYDVYEETYAIVPLPQRRIWGVLLRNNLVTVSSGGVNLNLSSFAVGARRTSFQDAAVDLGDGPLRVRTYERFGGEVTVWPGNIGSGGSWSSVVGLRGYYTFLAGPILARFTLAYERDGISFGSSIGFSVFQ
jgi:hypothetical protein